MFIQHRDMNLFRFLVGRDSVPMTSLFTSTFCQANNILRRRITSVKMVHLSMGVCGPILYAGFYVCFRGGNVVGTLPSRCKVWPMSCPVIRTSGSVKNNYSSGRRVSDKTAQECTKGGRGELYHGGGAKQLQDRGCRQ